MGRDSLLRLVKTADVVTENYRRGTLEKFGLGYDMLSRTNPGLIYCAVSGYGRDGPLGDKGGFDLIAQGFAGLMSVTGEPGRPPLKTGNPVADINAGILAVAGITAGTVKLTAKAIEASGSGGKTRRLRGVGGAGEAAAWRKKGSYRPSMWDWL